MPSLQRTRARLATSADYVPRRPHDTVLYGIVRDHLATFLASTERAYAAPLPRHVVETFEQYLACGDLAREFLRCHCDGCGHDVLVAFLSPQIGLDIADLFSSPDPRHPRGDDRPPGEALGLSFIPPAGSLRAPALSL